VVEINGEADDALPEPDALLSNAVATGVLTLAPNNARAAATTEPVSIDAEPATGTATGTVASCGLWLPCSDLTRRTCCAASSDANAAAAVVGTAVALRTELGELECTCALTLAAARDSAVAIVAA
jgi:hypothetical protein